MDLNINIKIKLDETPALLNTLSTFCEVVRAVAPLAIAEQAVTGAQMSTAPAANIAPAFVPEPPAMQQPLPVTAASVPASGSAPAAPAVQPLPTAVPTAAPKSYTLAEIQAACGPLMDAGKMKELAAVMQGMGVNSLMELPAERYGELAVKLRALGARL